jgi:phage baseplate assembly protein W
MINAARIAGIRFDGAGLGERADVAAGLTLTPSQRLATVSGGEAVRQSIMLLLTTSPGERVMRPDYGCPLHRLLFAPNDATTAGLAIHYVRQAILRFEPRAELVRVDAGGDPLDAGRLVVSLAYRVRATGERHQLDFDVQLDGEGR